MQPPNDLVKMSIILKVGFGFSGLTFTEVVVSRFVNLPILKSRLLSMIDEERVGNKKVTSD